MFSRENFSGPKCECFADSNNVVLLLTLKQSLLEKKQKPGFTDLESACTGSSAGKGIGKQGRKPDPESALRGFKIPEMTWWREASCGLLSTNQNGIGRWVPPVQAFKMDFSHIVSPLRKDHSNKDKRKEAKKCFNPTWKGVVSCNEKTWWASLCRPRGDWIAIESFY